MKTRVLAPLKAVYKLLFSRNIIVRCQQNGSAMVIALLVLALVLAFVALAVSRTTNETIAASNDAAETRAFSAAQASLEVMTRNFDKIFEEKLSPAPADLTHVTDLLPPDFDSTYSFDQKLVQTKDTQTVVMTGQLLQGLNALRDEWQLDTTATDKTNGVQVALRRQFYNNRIPIFQFGIFYDDDLEIHPGARFDFGGRVHSNASMFMMTSAGLYFSSRVSAVGQIFTDVARNGLAYTKWGEKTYIKNASGNYVQLMHDMGSVLTAPTNGTAVFASNADMPTVYKNTNWAANKAQFQGNLLSDQPRLDLPLVIASKINGKSLGYIELIKRGINVKDLYNNGTTVTAVPTTAEDTIVTSKERYYNKKGIRISLADSKAKLPGCATGTGTNATTDACGVRLDGDADGGGTYAGGANARGYQPMAMTDGYQGTRLNGERFFTGNQIWIKIELVGLDAVTNTIKTEDVTKDFLSLGITEAAPFGSSLNGYGTRDSRSILKLQRFAIPGATAITSADTAYLTYPAPSTVGSGTYNVVNTKKRTVAGGVLPTTWTAVDNGFTDNDTQNVCTPTPTLTNGNVQSCFVPFPIEMFDSREGLYTVGAAAGYKIGSTDKYNIPLNGVMSLIDIDVANFRKFFNGDFDTLTPNANTPYVTATGHRLRSSDVPQASGWVIYVSDRRGDADFDGEYDMENVYTSNPDEATNSTSAFQEAAEDINKNKKLDVDYGNEAVRYSNTDLPEKVSTIDHQYYRRGVRLINGTLLPGKYDSANSLNTKGFTVASENGVYVLGNYNASSIASIGTPTPYSDYGPQGANDIPASIVSDAVTILSNSWVDSNSFRYPFDITSNKRKASETFLRFAMLTGDAISSYDGNPNQGTGEGRLGGGVHNFKRFLEDWGSVRVNYCGSLINLFYSHNNNGTYKPDNAVYGAPTRNWVFDSSFLDPTRLPPGTPFFQNIQLTGFQRVN